MKEICIDIILVAIVILIGVAIGWNFVNGGWAFLTGMAAGTILGLVLFAIIQIVKGDDE